jgi:hypothetical protein
MMFSFVSLLVLICDIYSSIFAGYYYVLFRTSLLVCRSVYVRLAIRHFCLSLIRTVINNVGTSAFDRTCINPNLWICDESPTVGLKLKHHFQAGMLRLMSRVIVRLFEVRDSVGEEAVQAEIKQLHHRGCSKPVHINS